MPGGPLGSNKVNRTIIWGSMFKKLLITMVAACLLVGNLQAKSRDFDAVLTKLDLSMKDGVNIDNITAGEGAWLANHYPHLKVLDLSLNRLRGLPKSIRGLTKLEELHIGGNKFFLDDKKIRGSFAQRVNVYSAAHSWGRGYSIDDPGIYDAPEVELWNEEDSGTALWFCAMYDTKDESPKEWDFEKLAPGERFWLSSAKNLVLYVTTGEKPKAKGGVNQLSFPAGKTVYLRLHKTKKGAKLGPQAKRSFLERETESGFSLKNNIKLNEITPRKVMVVPSPPYPTFLQNVVALDFSNKGIARMTKEDGQLLAQRYPNLKRLNFDNNKLTTLSADVFEGLKELQDLRLVGNLISVEDLRKLQNGLKGVKQGYVTMLADWTGIKKGAKGGI